MSSAVTDQGRVRPLIQQLTLAALLLCAIILRPPQCSRAATPALERSVGEVPQFRDGDRWCVLGDSITRAGMYGDYVELFYATRYPDRRLEVINCGVAGDTASGALLRLDSDCLNEKPSIVSVMFGMNDIGRNLYDLDVEPQAVADERAQKMQQYDQAMQRLVTRLAASGAEVILIRPSIFDDSAQMDCPNKPGLGAALNQLGLRVDALAKELQICAIDFNTPLEEINRRLQQQDPHYTIVGPDRVHPKEPGHFVMAYQLLVAQNNTRPISRIEIDATTGSIGSLENCEVDALESHLDGIAFDCCSNSLPYPVEAAAVPALEFVPFMEQLNDEELCISGLESDVYELLIDDTAIGIYSADELAAGINLANKSNTPQVQQATLVLNKLREKWELVSKLRSVAYCEHYVRRQKRSSQGIGNAADYIGKMIPTFPDRQYRDYLKSQCDTYREIKPVEAKIKRDIQAIQNDVYALSQPKRHHYEIRRSTGDRLSKVPMSSAE